MGRMPLMGDDASADDVITSGHDTRSSSALLMISAHRKMISLYASRRRRAFLARKHGQLVMPNREADYAPMLPPVLYTYIIHA